MSEGEGRAWRFYLADMVLFAERAMEYTAGMNQARFVESGLTYDATVRNLELYAGTGSNDSKERRI